MNVRSICRRNVLTIDHEETLKRAAQLMRQSHLGALVVTAPEGKGHRMCGMLTDRDLTIEAVARGIAESTPVGEIVGTRAVVISGDASLSDAIASMRAEGVRRLLVSGADRELDGILSLDDVIDALARDMIQLGTAIREVFECEASLRPGVPGGAGHTAPISLESLAEIARP